MISKKYMMLINTNSNKILNIKYQGKTNSMIFRIYTMFIKTNFIMK